MRSQKRQRRRQKKRKNTGWEKLEVYLWCHLRGTCERLSKDTKSGVWWWLAKPNEGESKQLLGIRKAKKHVELNGRMQTAKPMPGKLASIYGINERI